jgi:mRNA interferase MazF
VRRGEIWTAAGGGGYSGKPRPIVIVQDERFSETDSIVVCPLTTDVTSIPLFRIVIDPNTMNGLAAVSRLMVDKLSAVPRTRLGRRIGRLDDATMLRLNRAITVFLGIAG